MEKRWTGLKNLGIQGLGTGNIDLSLNGWHHKVKKKESLDFKGYNTSAGLILWKGPKK